MESGQTSPDNWPLLSGHREDDVPATSICGDWRLDFLAFRIWHLGIHCTIPYATHFDVNAYR